MRTINIVTSTGHRGWAIGSLARSIQSSLVSDGFGVRLVEFPQSRRQTHSIYGWKIYPRAKMHLFMHQDLLLTALNKSWVSQTDHIVIRYTHNNRPQVEYLDALLTSCRILVENSNLKREMVQLGVDTNKIEVRPHPIVWSDFSRYRDIPRKGDVVFVSNFYPRKRPDLVLSTVKAMPHISFTLLGRGWQQWQEFDLLESLNNFSYMEFDYKKYPAILAQHRIFCSLSDLEGGPVPLLESLTAGLIPVVTDTGYVRDVLPGSKGGVVLPVSPDIRRIVHGLEQALKMKSGKVDTKSYDISNFASLLISQIEECLNPDVSHQNLTR